MRKFSVGEAIHICHLLKTPVFMHVNENGQLVNAIYRSCKREDLLELKKELDLGEIRKRHYSTTKEIDWEIGNLWFFGVEECQIVRYEERVVPAQPEKIEKVPIYICGEEDSR